MLTTHKENWKCANSHVSFPTLNLPKEGTFFKQIKGKTHEWKLGSTGFFLEKKIVLACEFQDEYDDEEGRGGGGRGGRDGRTRRRDGRRAGCGTIMVLLAVDFFTIALLLVLYAQLHERTCKFAELDLSQICVFGISKKNKSNNK